MSEMKITFKHPDEILDFVNTVSKYEFDMDMKKGHVVVDAKSLLELCILVLIMKLLCRCTQMTVKNFAEKLQNMQHKKFYV